MAIVCLEQSEWINLNDFKNAFKSLQVVMHFFIEMAVAMTIGFFVGRAIDTYLFEDKHIFVFIFIFLGLIASIRSLYVRTMKSIGGENDADKKSKSD